MAVPSAVGDLIGFSSFGSINTLSIRHQFPRGTPLFDPPSQTTFEYAPLAGDLIVLGAFGPDTRTIGVSGITIDRSGSAAGINWLVASMVVPSDGYDYDFTFTQTAGAETMGSGVFATVFRGATAHVVGVVSADAGAAPTAAGTSGYPTAVADAPGTVEHAVGFQVIVSNFHGDLVTAWFGGRYGPFNAPADWTVFDYSDSGEAWYVHVHTAIPPLPGPAQCFEQEALVDNPTGLWMPGMLDHRVIADLSGNDRDLVEEWQVQFIGDAHHSDFSSDLASFTPWADTGAIFPGQHMVAFIIATDSDQSTPGTPIPPPTIGGPYLWSGAITTPGWSVIGSTSLTWSFVLSGTTIHCATTMTAFHYIVTGTEDPSQIIYWRPSGVTPFSALAHGKLFALDVNFGDAFPTNKPLALTIQDVVFASTFDAPVNWPSFTPPSERYITLNMALASNGAEPGYDAPFGVSDYAPTGTSFFATNPHASGDDALRVDFHFENEAPPTRGFAPVGTASTALGLCTIVFGGADALYWTPVADEPFCTSCGPSRLGTLQSSQGRHLAQYDLFTSTTATPLELYGGTAYGGGTYHSFTLELVAKVGQAPSDFVGVQVGGIEIDTPSWLTPPAQLYLVTPGAGSSSGVPADVKCWHHYVFTYDHATTTSKLYIDDEIVSTHVATAYPPGEVDGAWMTAWMGSKVAAYAVYDYALTPDRVNAHFNQLCFLCAENTWTVKTNRKPGTTQYLSRDARIDRLRKRNRA